MAKFRIWHQVTFDEYLSNQDDLFPHEVSIPVARRSNGSACRVSASAPVFPDAPIDGIGAVPAAPVSIQVVRSFGRKKMSG